MTSGAIAVFVKTVGYSPVKTRLARGIGPAAAETFHCLAAQAIAAVIKQATAVNPCLTPYWAVAELEGMRDPAWQCFRQIWQGEGGLGTKLDQVYCQLLQNHQFVLLLGADSPQISPEYLLQAATWAGQGQFVIGLAADGGFYLFGGGRAIPRSVWESVPYSEAKTAKTLMNLVAPSEVIQMLPALLDVDTIQDLQQLRVNLAQIETLRDPELISRRLLPEQSVLLDWINHLLSKT